MDNVSVVVTKKLDFNVLWSVQKSLDEDCSITESRFGLAGGSLELIFQVVTLSDDTHTTATTTKGSFDDNGVTIFFDEMVAVLKGIDWSWRARHARNVVRLSNLSG